MNSPLPPQKPPQTPKVTSPSKLEINTFNFAMVGGAGDMIAMMHPMAANRMTKAQALVLAAWLVALSGGMEAFIPVLEAVEAT